MKKTPVEKNALKSFNTIVVSTLYEVDSLDLYLRSFHGYATAEAAAATEGENATRKSGYAPQFIMDISMHKVAKYFRLLGYCTVCDASLEQRLLVPRAAEENLILVTCSRFLFEQVETYNRRLLKQRQYANRQKGRVVAYDSDGESIYSSSSDQGEHYVLCLFIDQWRSKQFNEMMVNLIRTLHLTYRPLLVFSLCVECNMALQPVAYELVEHRVVPKIYAMYKEFTECPRCKKVFWGFDGDRVVNYKSFRTLELLRSLCLSAGADFSSDRTSLLSLKSFRSFPRSVKSCILAFLPPDDMDTFLCVFPVLQELTVDVRHFQETGEPVKTFSEIKQCRKQNS